MTLTEFVLARIAEDEEWARSEGVLRGFRDGAPGPARVLAECEAKRRIVARYGVCSQCYDEGNRIETRVLEWASRLIALPYVDNPEYRDEWRPERSALEHVGGGEPAT